jgi:hypothetical protein
VAAYVPPGWPAGVHPPGSEEFEQTAVTWLLDVVPPDYRLHGVLRRHPLALAVLARHHLAACVQAARDGYRTARTELAGLPPGGVDAVLEVYRAEGRRLVETARAVDLIGRALRGQVFTPQLGNQRRDGPPRSAAPEAAAPPGAAPPAPPAAAPGAAARVAAPREAAARGAAQHVPAPREAGGREVAARDAPVPEAGAREKATRGNGPRKGAMPEGRVREGGSGGSGGAEKARGAGRRAAKPGPER